MQSPIELHETADRTKTCLETNRPITFDKEAQMQK